MINSRFGRNVHHVLRVAPWRSSSTTVDHQLQIDLEARQGAFIFLEGRIIMALRSRGSSWVSEKRHKGQHFRKTIGRKKECGGNISKTRAKEIDQKWVADFMDGKLEKEKAEQEAEISFEEAADLYLDYFAECVDLPQEAEDKRSHKTLRCYRSNMVHLSAFFGQKKLSEITDFSLRSYRKSRSDFRTASNRELALFSAIFNHARAKGKTKSANPLTGLKLKFQETKRTRSLTEEESSRFFSELADHAFLPFAIEHYCGLRLQSQVLHLKHDDLTVTTDPQTGERVGSLIARAVYSKNGHEISVPVPPWLLERLEAHIEKSDPEVNKEGWLFTHENGKRRKGMISAFQGACRRVQEKYGDHLLKDFHIHDLSYVVSCLLF